MRILLAAALALVLAGCASSTAPATTTTGAADAHLHMAPQTVEVAMQGNRFTPSAIDVHEGDSVRWTHMDGMATPHNVAADDGSFDSNPDCDSTIPVGIPLPQACMVGGQTYTHRFDQAGTVAYRCRVHSGMTGTVHVLPHDMAAMNHTQP